MWACNLVMAIFLLLLLQERLAAILSILEIYIYNSKETSAHCPITEEADMALGYCPLLPAPPCSFLREEIVGPFELPSLTSLHLHDTPRAARSILRDMVMIYFSKSPGGSVCFSGWIMILKTIINFYVFLLIWYILKNNTIQNTYPKGQTTHGSGLGRPGVKGEHTKKMNCYYWQGCQEKSRGKQYLPSISLYTRSNWTTFLMVQTNNHTVMTKTIKAA